MEVCDERYCNCIYIVVGNNVSMEMVDGTT